MLWIYIVSICDKVAITCRNVSLSLPTNAKKCNFIPNSSFQREVPRFYAFDS